MKHIAPGHDRRQYIGGSDVSSILGINPWKTALDLWYEKIATHQPEAQMKAVFKRGIRWEGAVAEMLVEDMERQGHKIEIVGSNHRYADAEIAFFASEIDFEIKIDGASEITNVELKTVHPFRIKEWGESGTDELPLHYLAQVMWGLGVTRRKQGRLAVLFGADELRTYSIEADAQTIEAMRSRAQQFWFGCVQANEPPGPTTLSDIDLLYPQAGDQVEPLRADDQLTAQVLRLRAIKQEIDAREAESLAIEFDLRLALKQASELLLPNGKLAIEWKGRSGSYFDETAFKAEHPGLAKQFNKKWEKRVFRLKAFDTKGL